MNACYSIVAVAFMTLLCACAQAEDENTVEQSQNVETAELVVINVAPDDVLNIRAEPNAGAALVGELAPGTGDIRVTAQGTETLDWVHIEAGGLEGWVNAAFLAYSTNYEPLPIRLHCSGTEPFWGTELSYSRADVSFAFRDEHFRTGFHGPISPLNRTNIWLRTRFDLESDFVLLESETCSDGMSERKHAYLLFAKIDGNLLGGCCD